MVIFFSPMAVSISSLVPNVEDLLAFDVEEVAGILLVHLISFGNNSGDGIVSRDKIGQVPFFTALDNRPIYPKRNEEVLTALMEAWNWLEREGLLVRDALQYRSPWFFLSRRAREMKSRDDLDGYRNGKFFPKGQHELIAAKVYPAFLRKEYDTAIFQAFREVEVAVREAGGFQQDVFGTKLMRDAFRPADPEKPSLAPGPLTDKALPIAEQKGMADLFAGSIALFKNPTSHRIVNPGPIEAAEVIALASHLLRIVDRLRSA
jgi:uncharacterized protein (TIGR02391 family)